MEEEDLEEDEGAVEGGYDAANKEGGRGSRARFNGIRVEDGKQTVN